MTAAVLWAVGTVVGVCVNPIGVILHAMTMNKSYLMEVKTCPFVYTSYQKKLNTLRGCL